MVLGERWVLKHQFDGLPKVSDFELVKEELGPVEEGEVAFEAEWLSVDPYQRAYVRRMTKFPMTMIGTTVAKITESKNPRFKVGDLVWATIGWVRVGKVNPDMKSGSDFPLISLVPDIQGLPTSLLLGACGMPGNTAYFGLLELCQPKEGEFVVVNGAAGAVGSLVGQIARIKGCKVMGFAGTDAKCNWLKEELGFDYAFNYKKTQAEKCLKKADKGVDCFFDNVGGTDSSTVMAHMNKRGRIAVCGAISTYNDKEVAMAPVVQGYLVGKELRMEGFLVNRWAGERWNEGITQMAKWIKAGRIKPKETIIKGFDKTPEAFIGLLTGDNIGKMVVKC